MSAIFYTLLPDHSIAQVASITDARISEKLFRTSIGNIDVSTVFLGLDHGWSNVEKPILFETMVFTHDGCGSEFAGYQERYSTYEEAKAGHEKLVQRIQDCMIP